MHGCSLTALRITQDDKGGLITALAALEACLKGTGRLPVNVKVGPTSCNCSLIICFTILPHARHACMQLMRPVADQKISVYPICRPHAVLNCVKQ